MEEAFQLCDNIAIVDHGKIISSGDPRKLLEDFSSQVIVRIPKESLSQNDRIAVKALKEYHEQELFFEFPTDNLNDLCSFFIEKKIDLKKMTIRKKDFEDLFIYLTGKDLRD